MEKGENDTQPSGVCTAPRHICHWAPSERETGKKTTNFPGSAEVARPNFQPGPGKKLRGKRGKPRPECDFQALPGTRTRATT